VGTKKRECSLPLEAFRSSPRTGKLDRGQMPREFACFALEYDSNARWHMYSMPAYRGNLIANFNPVSTANAVERLLPKLESDPFVRLLANTHLSLGYGQRSLCDPKCYRS
jgi:hypothetical protein